MRIIAVIGLGFGDEGKGQTVSNICRNFEPYNTLVVRFNGGHQAGHTVIYNGKKHVFANFGSGTLQGFSTYFSEFCTIDPIGIYNETQVLKQQGINNPVLYINPKCPVVTPFDKIRNQYDEKNLNHGTVGVGFGTTIQREEDHYSLLLEDLFHPLVLKEKMRLIGNYYNKPVYLKNFYKAIDFMQCECDCRVPPTDLETGFENFILEGAQGLLLDQNYGFFPHVTRSNTGSKNIQKLFPGKDIEFYLVTRAYQTRHGNGPMTNENIPHKIKLSKNETNVFNNYQGHFRYSLLDVDLLNYGICKDKLIKASKKKFVITCLNAVKNDYRFTTGGKIINCKDKKDFIKKVIYFLK